MKAFVEPLSGIVRVGETTEKYGDSFEYAVVFSSVDGKTAVVKALVSNGKFSRTYARAIIKALKDIGLKAVWERQRRIS